MAKSGRMGGDPNARMSNVMSGVRHRGAGEIRAGSTVRSESYVNNPTLGTSGPFKTTTLTTAPGKTNLQKPKNVPRTFVPSPRKPVAPPPAVAVLPPVKKPPAKKPPQVVSNVAREKLTPAPTSAKPRTSNPFATRFGIITGKETATRVSGGGGYGGGGTRGGGSLSGQGSGSRSAGTSRTGGTRSNNPVRG